MPCRDYNDHDENAFHQRQVDLLQERNDKLARIACKAMTLIEELGKEDFLLLEDEEVREWWANHKIMDERYNKGKT
jgi:hypothetical protein